MRIRSILAAHRMSTLCLKWECCMILQRLVFGRASPRLTLVARFRSAPIVVPSGAVFELRLIHLNMHEEIPFQGVVRSQVLDSLGKLNQWRFDFFCFSRRYVCLKKSRVSRRWQCLDWILPGCNEPLDLHTEYRLRGVILQGQMGKLKISPL